MLFRALTFNQPGGHKANGGSINITSTYWTTIGSVVACRLAPGEFTEMIAPGIGVGPHDKEAENWRNIRIGSWIGAQVGDEVTFTPAAVLLNSDRAPSDGEPDWWLNFIKNRLSLAAPLPADAAERGACSSAPSTIFSARSRQRRNAPLSPPIANRTHSIHWRNGSRNAQARRPTPVR